MTERAAVLGQGLDDEARRGVAILLDVLLPGTSVLPSGRELCVHLGNLDRVLDAEPAFLPAVAAFGRRAAATGSVTIETLSDWLQGGFNDVVFALSAAYYMSPVVMRALGYPGQQRRPIALAGPQELITNELLAPVLARGPTYVATPEPRQ